MLQYTKLATISVSKNAYKEKRHFSTPDKPNGFSPLPRIKSEGNVAPFAYYGYLGKTISQGWTPIESGETVIPRRNADTIVFATYGNREYSVVEERVYCQIAVKTDNLLLPVYTQVSEKAGSLRIRKTSYELLEYFNEIGVPWQIGSREQIHFDFKAFKELSEYGIYPNDMAMLGIPSYDINEDMRTGLTDGIHPFFGQFLFTENGSGTKRLHETAKKNGLSIPEGEVSFKTYVEQILIPMGIEPIGYSRIIDTRTNACIGVLPNKFRIRNPKLMMGYIGGVQLLYKNSTEEIAVDLSYSLVPLSSITEFKSGSLGNNITITAQGDVFIRGYLDILPPPMTVKKEILFESYNPQLGSKQRILIPESFDDVIPAKGVKFYSDTETFLTVDGTRIIRRSDLDNVKAQTAEIDSVLKNPCMREYTITEDKIRLGGIYGNPYGVAFTRGELLRLLELKSSHEYLSYDDIYDNPQGIFKLVGEWRTNQAWLEHLGKEKLITSEQILRQTFIRAGDVTYDLLISDIAYIAENIPVLYTVIKTMAVTTPELAATAEKAIKAYECTTI